MRAERAGDGGTDEREVHHADEQDERHRAREEDSRRSMDTSAYAVASFAASSRNGMRDEARPQLREEHVPSSTAPGSTASAAAPARSP